MIVVAVMSAIGRYDTTFFWIHMIQHLLLIMIAPALLIHGRPLTLAMHATRSPWLTWIKRRLRSRLITILTCPLVASRLSAGAVVITHLTSLNNQVVLHQSVAAAEQAIYLVVGHLYLVSGLVTNRSGAVCRGPRRWSFCCRPCRSTPFTSLTLLTTQHEPWLASTAQHHAWGPGLITDVHGGGQ